MDYVGLSRLMTKNEKMAKKPSLASASNVFGKLVGASRFERPTSCSQGRRANQAALRPAI